jgi:hypothetical protein
VTTLFTTVITSAEYELSDTPLTIGDALIVYDVKSLISGKLI